MNSLRAVLGHQLGGGDLDVLAAPAWSIGATFLEHEIVAWHRRAASAPEPADESVGLEGVTASVA